MLNEEGDSSKLENQNDEQSKVSNPKKVHFKNTVVAFINDGIDFWKFTCKTEPLHTNKKSKKNFEKLNENFDSTRKDKHVKNKRKRKKK